MNTDKNITFILRIAPLPSLPSTLAARFQQCLYASHVLWEVHSMRVVIDHHYLHAVTVLQHLQLLQVLSQLWGGGGNGGLLCVGKGVCVPWVGQRLRHPLDAHSACN
jgi:hypothetical protein